MNIDAIKRLAGRVIVAFALISLGVAIGDMRATRAAAPVAADAGSDAQVSLVLYRGSGLCPTCDKMENLTRELFSDGKTQIAGIVRDGKITFGKVDLEKPGNEHFFDDYDLYTTTLVLSYKKDGKEIRWKSLPKGWELAEQPQKFKSYVAAEIEKFAKDSNVI